MDPLQIIPHLPIERPFFAEAADKCRFRLMGESSRLISSIVSTIISTVALIFANLNVLRNKQQRAASALYWKLHRVHAIQEFNYALFGLLPLLFSKTESRPLSSEWAISQAIVKASSGLSESQKRTFLSHKFIRCESPISFARNKGLNTVKDLLQNYGFTDRRGILESIETDTNILKEEKERFFSIYQSLKKPDLLHAAFKSRYVRVIEKMLTLHTNEQIQAYINSHSQDLSELSIAALSQIASKTKCAPLLDFVENAFMDACIKGNVGVVDQLILADFFNDETRRRYQGKKNYLWQACHAGQHGVVQRLLVAGVSLDRANEVAPGELPLIHDLGVQYVKAEPNKKATYETTLETLLTACPPLASISIERIAQSSMAFFLLQNGLQDNIPKRNFYPLIKILMKHGARLDDQGRSRDGLIYKIGPLIDILKEQDRNAFLNSLSPEEFCSATLLSSPSIIEFLCRNLQIMESVFAFCSANNNEQLRHLLGTVFDIARKKHDIELINLVVTYAQVFDTEADKQRFLEALRADPNKDPLLLGLQQDFSSNPNAQQKRNFLLLCKGVFLGNGPIALEEGPIANFLRALENTGTRSIFSTLRQRQSPDPMQVALNNTSLSSPAVLFYLLRAKTTYELCTFVENLATSRTTSEGHYILAFDIARSEGWTNLANLILNRYPALRDSLPARLDYSYLSTHDTNTKITDALIIYERQMTTHMSQAFVTLYTTGNLQLIPPSYQGSTTAPEIPKLSCLGIKATDEETKRLIAIFKKHPVLLQSFSTNLQAIHDNFMKGLIYIWEDYNLLKPEDRRAQADALLKKLEALTSEQFWDCLTLPHDILNATVFQHPCWIGPNWRIQTTKDFAATNPELTILNVRKANSRIAWEVSFLDKNLTRLPGIDQGGPSNEFLFILLNSLFSGKLNRMINLTAVTSSDPHSMKIPEYRIPLRVQLTPQELQELDDEGQKKKRNILRIDAKRQKEQLCLDLAQQPEIYTSLGYVFAQCYISSLNPMHANPLVTGKFFEPRYFGFIQELCKKGISPAIFNNESTISEQDKRSLLTIYNNSLGTGQQVPTGAELLTQWTLHKNKIHAALYIAHGIMSALRDPLKESFNREAAANLCNCIQGRELGFQTFKEHFLGLISVPGEGAEGRLTQLGRRLLSRWLREHTEEDAKDLCLCITGTRSLSRSLQIVYTAIQQGVGGYFVHACTSTLELSRGLLTDSSLKDENERYLYLSGVLADAIAQSKSKESYNTR